MTDRGLTFGAAAAAYETFRPGYPDELFETVRDYAGRPFRDALEIGAGTGKATRLFAAHGVSVLASEPDAAMLDELRRHVPSTVTTVQATFEELDTSRTFDLFYAAAALHWTTAQGRWDRVAALLVPGGTFASFGGPTRLADANLEAAVRSARAPWLSEDEIPPPDGTSPTSPMRWPGTELQASDLFTDVRQVALPMRHTSSARHYVGLLSTVSAYLQLPDADRRAALRAILDALPDEVELRADIDLHLARRR